ncbi:hypothetical protein QYE76_048441 [Lolium multiflorum]|uniref:Uncharacterized protein n=1 Tax=Lolium multiflorum TaxID=4521 RepID=A0AAD8SL19_LOLMU|nr:hypothetical protein QYE76_048441 [Lolium multiflorum]
MVELKNCGAQWRILAEESRGAAQAKSTLDARKQLFEELLWEHRELSEAHGKCQAVPEATVEALSSQVATLQAEKEQLAKEHK